MKALSTAKETGTGCWAPGGANAKCREVHAAGATSDGSFAAPHEFLQRILVFNRSQNWFTQQRLHKNHLSSMIERHGFLMFLAICPKISLKPSHFLHIFCIFCWQELTSFSRQMDMLLPLVMAAWRCKLVRDAAVIFLGLVLLLLGQDLSM